jgi:hypothetical protein
LRPLCFVHFIPRRRNTVCGLISSPPISPLSIKHWLTPLDQFMCLSNNWFNTDWYWIDWNLKFQIACITPPPRNRRSETISITYTDYERSYIWNIKYTPQKCIWNGLPTDIWYVVEPQSIRKPGNVYIYLIITAKI